MWEMARRLNSKRYVLTGILLGTCIYIYGIKFTTRHLRDQTNGISVAPFDTITIRPHRASLEATSDDNVENLIHSWVNNKEEGNENVNIMRKSAEVVDAESDKMQIPLPNVNHNAVNQNTPEEEEISLGDESATSYNKVKPSSTHQSDRNIIGIENFPPLKTVPVENNDNKTLQLLDLWNFDEKCAGFQVGLLEDNTVERRALVSFPGSGNSWLRMLIQGVSGIFVDSVYPDGEDNLFHSKANSTYQVPIDCGCTLLQKTHDFSLDAMLFYLPEANRTHTINEFKGKGILIIRNPFSSIRSYRNFDSGGMQGMAPDAAFQGQKWDNFVARSVASWETLAQVWIRGLKQGGIIYYEKLRHEMPSELARLSKMLGLTYDQERLDCVIRHAKDNSFKRDSASKTKADPYTASQRLLIHKAIEGVQAVLKERGLDPLPTQYYELFSLLPEYGFQSNTTRQ